MCRYCSGCGCVCGVGNDGIDVTGFVGGDVGCCCYIDVGGVDVDVVGGGMYVGVGSVGDDGDGVDFGVGVGVDIGGDVCEYDAGW